MSINADQKVRLDELVELRPEKTTGAKDVGRPYVGLEHLAQGAPRLLGFLPSEASVSTNCEFDSGDILFGKLRPNLRKSVRVSFQGYCSTDILVLRAREGIDPGFAAHVLRWNDVFKAATATAAGTKMPRTSWNHLKRFRVFCPEVPEDQHRIAAVLDTVDEAIAATEAVIAKLKQVRAGLLHDLLTRGLDEHGQLRDPLAHPEQFKESPLGKIPRAWGVLPVEAVGEVRLGRQRSPAHEVGRHIRPYLRVANVFDGLIDYSDILTMNFTPGEQRTYGLLPGDILLNEGQSLELVGRSAIFPGPVGVYCFQNTLVRFRCGVGAIPEFCQPVFKLWLDTRRFTTIAKQTTSVAHLGADRFAKLSFPLPSLEEQRLIADILMVNAQSTSPERCRILDGLLRFRAELHRSGFTVGFHWLDGSFLEDIEHLETRPPRDIDVVTFIADRTGPPLTTVDLQLFDPDWVRTHFEVDSYFVELSLPSPDLVAWSAYWYSVWSHRRTQLWRGYLQIELSPDDDDAARAHLQRIQMPEE